MKYEIGKQTVTAVYDNSGTRNPLIEALPESLGQEEFFRSICSLPPVTKDRLTPTERTRALSLISTLFVPLEYMYGVYESLFRMLRSSYYTMTSRESCGIRDSNTIWGAVGDSWTGKNHDNKTMLKPDAASNCP